MFLCAYNENWRVDVGYSALWKSLNGHRKIAIILVNELMKEISRERIWLSACRMCSVCIYRNKIA